MKIARWRCIPGSRKRKFCRPPADRGLIPTRPRSLADIVRDYRARYGKHSSSPEVAFFSRQPSWADVLRFAALATGPGDKRFPHQYRIPRAVLNRAYRALVPSEGNLRTAESFAALQDEIRRCVQGIKGIGELYIY